MPILEFIEDYTDAVEEIEKERRQLEFQMKQSQKQRRWWDLGKTLTTTIALKGSIDNSIEESFRKISEECDSLDSEKLSGMN